MPLTWHVANKASGCCSTAAGVSVTIAARSEPYPTRDGWWAELHSLEQTPTTLILVQRQIVLASAVLLAIAATERAGAIEIVLDYTLDANNEDWFGAGTPGGPERRSAVDTAAEFLSAIITNDDWNSLPTLNESFTLSDIAASSLNDLDGNSISGSAESDGAGFGYNISTTNISSVGANEYIVYVGAFQFDSGTSSHAKGGWDSNDRRNQAGIDLVEFNTWGGKIYFDSSDTWYAGQNPGLDPADDYGVQDPDKTPATDIPTDNWDWSGSSMSWKGFDLESIDPGGRRLARSIRHDSPRTHARPGGYYQQFRHVCGRECER